VLGEFIDWYVKKLVREVLQLYVRDTYTQNT